MSKLSVVLLGGLLCVQVVGAATFDWDDVTWTNGATSGTFTNVDGSGVDVSINISGGSFLSGYPQTNTANTGGFSNPGDSLQLFINESGQWSGMDVTITFSQPVENLSLTLFDVDVGPRANNNRRTFQDIVIFNTTPDNLTTSADNAAYAGYFVYGTGENDSNQGGGNVYATYNEAMTSVSFFYGSGWNTQNNPAQQAISLYDFTFTPTVVPEPGTICFGVALCVLAGIEVMRRRNSNDVSECNV
ncbi:MAG: hypothetical protein ACQKBV_00050 [Puniceicoccales bacterium]